MEGISNAIWGPVYWKMFHFVTITFPISPDKNNIEKIKYFFCDLVPCLLPCHICRQHYQKNLDLFPLTDDILSIKFKLVIWLLDMHNYINLQLGKQQMSYEDALVFLFVPYNLQNNTIYNNTNYNTKKSLYCEKKLKEQIENVAFGLSDDFVYNIKEITEQKEKEIEFEIENNKNLKQNLKKSEDYCNYITTITNNVVSQKHVNGDINKTINYNKQTTIDMQYIINKILYFIEKCEDDRDKYLIYTGFESISFIFS